MQQKGVSVARTCRPESKAFSDITKTSQTSLLLNTMVKNRVIPTVSSSMSMQKVLPNATINKKNRSQTSKKSNDMRTKCNFCCKYCNVYYYSDNMFPRSFNQRLTLQIIISVQTLIRVANIVVSIMTYWPYDDSLKERKL